MPHVVDVPTRWGDMDAQAHLNNGVFVDFLQEARVDFLHSGPFGYLLGEEDDPEHAHDAILVVSHQVEYRRPVVHGQRVQVELSVVSVGAARFEVAYNVTADGEVAARARTVLCVFDRRAQRIRRFTPEERAWFSERIESVEPLRELPRPPDFEVQKAFRGPLKVRWSDIDQYRHVNNVRFYDYAQEARITMMRTARAAFESTEPSENMWLVVRQDVDYLGQVRFRREPYSVLTVLERLGGSSMMLRLRLLDEETGEQFATARTVLVHTGPDGRPLPIDDRIRHAMAPYVL
ncbi:acyl-CoA thioesterase [Naumannella sp. ID2617S]|nr:acyl-CoA thioesterase [Naumannella sp. ID2617S]